MTTAKEYVMEVKVIALSIIVLLVLGTVLYVGLWKLFYIDLTKRHWREAKSNYPLFAQKMNLSYTPGELDTHIGQISGRLNGCQLAVKPDESATIEIQFRTSPELFLSSIAPDNIEPFPGMIRFDSGNAAFDRFFKTRFALPALASSLKKAAISLQFAERFTRTWGRPMQRFDITRNGLECRFKYGGQTYIPTDILESLLPEMCSFAQSFESLLTHADTQEKTPTSD